MNEIKWHRALESGNKSLKSQSGMAQESRSGGPSKERREVLKSYRTEADRTAGLITRVRSVLVTFLLSWDLTTEKAT